MIKHRKIACVPRENTFEQICQGIQCRPRSDCSERSDQSLHCLVLNLHLFDEIPRVGLSV